MNPRATKGLHEEDKPFRAFTLIELLVVIAVIGLLVALLLPTLAAAKKEAQIPVCLNDARQLQMAWAHFADDNNGELLSNTDYFNLPVWSPGKNWILGVMGYETTLGSFEDSTSVSRLTDPKHGQIGPYIQSGKVFKCPGDKSYFLKNGVKVPRNRSFSMNEWLGNQLPNPSETTYTSPVRHMMTRESVRSEDFFVFIEEHEDSIDDGQFRIAISDDGTLRNSADSLRDIPASRHNDGATVSFVDGWVELHRWVDSRTLFPVTRTKIGMKIVTNSQDADWLIFHGPGFTP